MRRALLGTTAVAVGATVAYRQVLRPWQERWGASEDEVRRVLPGDDLVAEPASQVTRAITIDAEPGDVWPWIVQLGADRGGFYSYDWLENLFGLQVHSADRIVDDWQDLAVADVIAATRSGAGGWYVAVLRPPEVMVLQLADLKAGRAVRREDPAGWEFAWTFSLEPADGARTRLVVRERVAFRTTAVRVAMAPFGLVSFVMTRKMLLGIRNRVETYGDRKAA